MIKISLKNSNSLTYLNSNNINSFSIQLQNRLLIKMCNDELIIAENSYEHIKEFNVESLKKFIQTKSKETQLTIFINKNNISYISQKNNGCVVYMLNGEEYFIEDNIEIFLT